MKILMLVQIFETPRDTGSERHYFIAKSFAQSGHQVEVVTANIDYKNACPRFDAKSSSRIVDGGGVKITYLPVYTRIRGSFWGKLAFFLSFCFAAIREIASAKDVNAVYAVSTPLTVGALGLLASKLKRVPFYFEVTDLWPDAAIETGAVKSKTLITMARALERICYASADRIVCLTEGIRRGVLAHKGSAKKALLVPNGVDFSLFEPVPEEETARLRSSLGFNGKFVAMYIGAHGVYNSLDTIVQAAGLLKDRKDIQFFLVGAGDVKESLEQYVADNGLTNIVFGGTVERVQSVKLLSVADVFLLPNRKGAFYEGNLPNKLFDYLASSKPIIVAGHGETAQVVADASAGTIVDAEEPKQLADAIAALASSDKSNRATMGANGRSYVMQNYDRRQQVRLLIDMIKADSVIM